MTTEARRPILRWTSVILFIAVSLFLIAFGVLYATVKDLLWFHAAAVPAAALADVRPLYFALMKLIGGASAALGILGLYVAVGPVRSRERFAGTALTVVLAIPVATAAIVAETLRTTTGAPTSWHIMGVLLAIIVGAYLAHLASGRR